MTASLLLLLTAATALVAVVASALVGLVLWASRRWLQTLTPSAESRVLFAAAVAPLVVTTVVMVAALAPSIGWVVDHCAPAYDLHGHPHICTAHHVSSTPALMVVLLAGFLASRLVLKMLWLTRSVVVSSRSRRSLLRLATWDSSSSSWVLPWEEPQAFVAGVIHPTLFVTRGLHQGDHREHLPAVVGHELAHLRRRDPLCRAVVSIALTFHIPGLARWIDRRVARAQEQAADAEAAKTVGDPAIVARALVALTRATPRAHAGQMAFGGSALESRVTRLLDEAAKRDVPRMSALAGIAVVFVAVVAVSADGVHHGVEALLGLIGG